MFEIDITFPRICEKIEGKFRKQTLPDMQSISDTYVSLWFQKQLLTYLGLCSTNDRIVYVAYSLVSLAYDGIASQVFGFINSRFLL